VGEVLIIVSVPPFLLYAFCLLYYVRHRHSFFLDAQKQVNFDCYDLQFKRCLIVMTCSLKGYVSNEQR